METTAHSFPAALIPSPTASAIASVLPVPDQYATVILLILKSSLFLFPVIPL